MASAAAQAGVHSGKATADLLAASPTYQPGQPLQVAVRLKMDFGWHTYWSNPGEGGMKLGVKWQLPPGWTAGEPGYPVPKAFRTGDLAGYGYEGTVVFPITLTPSAGATGLVKATAAISWLTCNDDACVPGKAEISLDLNQGAAKETTDAQEIRAATEKLPMPQPDWKFKVVEEGKTLELTLQGPEALDLAGVKVFPETEQAVDPAAKIEFKKSGGWGSATSGSEASVFKSGKVWSATVPKNEYATAPLKTLSLVIATEPPVRVTWAAENP
ncbi:MAG: protein-disulfide reductase DsbD family protein [Luteolibacter sp.]